MGRRGRGTSCRRFRPRLGPFGIEFVGGDRFRLEVVNGSRLRRNRVAGSGSLAAQQGGEDSWFRIEVEKYLLPTEEIT